MAISTPILAGNRKYPIEKDHNRWAINFPSDDFAGGGLNEELKAAPTRSNSAHYLTHVTMGVSANATAGYVMNTKVSLVDGAGVTVFGPIQFQSQGQTAISRELNPPIKLTDGKALDCSATSGGAGSYQGACFVYVEGFTADSPLG